MAAAMATAAPAIAPLLRLAAPLTKTGSVGAGLVETGTTGVVGATGAGAGAGTVDIGTGGHVVKTMMGVSGTFSVVQGMMTVRVASMQVDTGSSHLVQGSVVVHPTVTHSVALQVTVVVHHSQTGRVVGCHGLREEDLGGG